jgi:hypothetical protein
VGIAAEEILEILVFSRCGPAGCKRREDGKRAPCEGGTAA